MAGLSPPLLLLAPPGAYPTPSISAERWGHTSHSSGRNQPEKYFLLGKVALFSVWQTPDVVWPGEWECIHQGASATALSAP